MDLCGEFAYLAYENELDFYHQRLVTGWIDQAEFKVVTPGFVVYSQSLTSAGGCADGPSDGRFARGTQCRTSHVHLLARVGAWLRRSAPFQVRQQWRTTHLETSPQDLRGWATWWTSALERARYLWS